MQGATLKHVFVAALMAVAGLIASGKATAGISIPAGASIQLNGGTIAGAGDVTIAGQLGVGVGQLVGVDNLLVTSGGSLLGGAGLIELAGDWQVDGGFDPGSGTVRFVDGAFASSHIVGSNTFSTLSLVSMLGKHIVVDAGGIQTILAHLEITGTAADPLQIERLPSGAEGQFNLAAGGTQSIIHVGVSNVHANGQPLAPAETNEGGSGNATGWFGAVVAAAINAPELIPALSTNLLLLLSLLMAGVALASARSRSAS